jgi:hypothetical protein
MTKMAEYHARLRREIGEEAYLERMRQARAHRKDFGKPFRADYVDKQGRTGPEIAAAAGRLGGKMRAYKHKQEKKSDEQKQSQQSALN